MLRDVRGDNRDTVNLPEEVLLSEFADGAFGELDPFSSMIWPSDLEEFNKTTQGEFSGVGIQIQLDDDGSLKVVSPLEDSPAYKAGIKAGDIITKINGKSAKGITLNQAVKTITRFYRNYHSMRFVRELLVIRLNHAPSQSALDGLNEDFADIVAGEKIAEIAPTAEEREDDDAVDVPRIAFGFNRRDYGRLRQMIDVLNNF